MCQQVFGFDVEDFRRDLGSYCMKEFGRVASDIGADPDCVGADFNGNSSHFGKFSHRFDDGERARLDDVIVDRRTFKDQFFSRRAFVS